MMAFQVQGSTRQLVTCIAACGLLSAWLPEVCGKDPVDPTGRADKLTHETFASPTPLSGDRIAELIDQLDDDDYAAREFATQQLLRAGDEARHPLFVAAESANPEMRSRARRLLVLIDQVEFDRRLAAFAEDVDGQLGLTMPGWEEFQAIVGSEPPARSLFVKMQRHESAILKRVFGDRDPKSDQHLGALVAELNNWQRRRVSPSRGITNTRRGITNVAPPLASCVAALFVGAAMAAAPQAPQESAGVPESNLETVEATLTKLSDRTVNALGQLSVKPPLNSATSAGAHRHPIRVLLAHWVIHSPGVRPNVVQQKLNLIIVHELAEALSFAAAIAHNEPPYKQLRPQLHPRLRALAILAIGKFGTEQQVAELEPILGNASICYLRNGKNRNQQRFAPTVVQLGDVVLAVLIHRSGEDLTAHGFRDVKRDEQSLFKLATLGFENDEHRASALAKWQESARAEGTTALSQPAAKENRVE